MKRKKRIILLTILFLLSGTLLVGNFFMGPVDKNDETLVVFSVVENQSADTIISNLEEEGLIKSSFVAKVYIRLTNQSNFQTGMFELSKSQSLSSIIKTLNSMSNAESANVIFLEGWRVIDFAEVANTRLGINKEEFLAACNDKAFIDELKTKYEVIEKYQFNSEAIYQLEGLLAPDTYNLNFGISAKELINVLVAQTNKNYLENKELFDKSQLDINEIFTLASMVEAEVNTYDDRVLVASIFMNRIKNKMSLGSDVTTYYGLQVSMGDRDLTTAELAQVNGYNTRAAEFIGLPIGPICAPSLESIKAALNYHQTDYLYFVNDKNGKTYPAKTYDQHNEIIAELQEKGLWFVH